MDIVTACCYKAEAAAITTPVTAAVLAVILGFVFAFVLFHTGFGWST
ncbi:MAG: hypothetical protein JO297_00130 [Nitrososphaeraceae archaeon]|nr:hypothetical protein [Nitrososphaeraceae archaeon]